MNYQFNDVVGITHGYGFSITDSRRRPLVTFEFAHEDKAKEAHRGFLIGGTSGFSDL